MTKALQCIPILCMHCLPVLIKVLKWMSAWIPSFICHQLQLLPGQKNLILEIPRKELSSWAVQVWLSCGQLNFQFLQLLQKPDFFFLLEAYFFVAFTVYGTSGSFYNLWEKTSLSLISSPLLCVAADNHLWCARLREHYCHASHVWPQLCESASSRSAICPRPGSLIREESCGKVCVSLPDVPLSLQLFVRVGPQQQHQGPGDQHTSTLWRQRWRKVGNVPTDTRHW